MSAAGRIWTDSIVKLYGYGRGHAHPSVEHVRCPVCLQPPGMLCIGSNGEPHLDRHYKRCDAYRELRRDRKRFKGICGIGGCRMPATRLVVGSDKIAQFSCCSDCGAQAVLLGAGTSMLKLVPKRA